MRPFEIEQREADRMAHFALDDRDRAIIRLTDGKVTIHDVIDTADSADEQTPANPDEVARPEPRATE